MTLKNIEVDRMLMEMDVGLENTMSITQEECLEKYGKPDTVAEGGNSYCEAVWDSVLCWPAVPAGSTSWRPCQQVLLHFGSLDTIILPSDTKAFRVCEDNGEWLWGNWTNYNECLNFTTTDLPRTPLTVSLILLVCSLISLVFLGLTIFIFFYFKSLHCSRLKVHRNLIVALIIHSLMLIVISLPVVGEPNIPSYKDLNWLCKTVLAVKMYAALASINWMFVEGMLLHSRITTNIFQKDAPFKLYYFIGWGLPLLLIISWCCAMTFTSDTPCWEGYGRTEYVWLLTGPMIAALCVNLVFLVNIIRILVTKMKTTSSCEIIQIRRAIKATALLFPLLGITHLLFCVNPRDDSKLEEAYMITNATLQSSQGIFVSILYCFMNIEVQTVLRKAYVRAALRRNPNHRYTWKCRSTRTSNSSTFVSNCENSNNLGDAIGSNVRSLGSKSKLFMRRETRAERIPCGTIRIKCGSQNTNSTNLAVTDV